MGSPDTGSDKASDLAKLAFFLITAAERATRIELASSVWKTEALPLSYARADLGKRGSRPVQRTTEAAAAVTGRRRRRHVLDLSARRYFNAITGCDRPPTMDRWCAGRDHSVLSQPFARRGGKEIAAEDLRP